MQFKKKLLSSVIASAVTFGLIGAAHAATIGVTVSGTAAGVSGVPVANEIIFTADAVVGDDVDDGQAVISVDRTGGTFPSGNLVLKLTLAGATFDGAMLAGSVTFDAGCAGATSVISTGGLDGTSTVNYVLSNLDACVALADGFVVTLPFDVNGPAASSLTMRLVTESGDVPVDNIGDVLGNGVVLPLTQAVSAFTVDIDTSPLNTVVADVSAVGGPYRRFIGNTVTDQIGDVEIAVNTSVAVDLNGAGPITTASGADVSGATLTVTGDMSAYSGAGGVNLAGIPEAVIAGSTATTVLTGPQLTAVISAAPGGALNTSDELIELVANDTTQIQASAYSATLAVDLVATLTDESATATILPVTRNGTSVILPWTASNTQAAGTGSSNFVRVSNPGTAAYGPIFATVLSGTVPGLVGTTATLSPSLAAGAEVLFTAAQLETALGNFGRADIQITVEGQGAIVKRLIQRPDGTYEINNVTTGSPS